MKNLPLNVEYFHSRLLLRRSKRCWKYTTFRFNGIEVKIVLKTLRGLCVFFQDFLTVCFENFKSKYYPAAFLDFLNKNKL